MAYVSKEILKFVRQYVFFTVCLQSVSFGNDCYGRTTILYVCILSNFAWSQTKQIIIAAF